MSELVQADTGRTSHVESEMQSLPEHLNQLHETLTELEKRLDGVLSKDEENDKIGSTPHEILVPLADRLHDANNQVFHAVALVRSMLRRLEL